MPPPFGISPLELSQLGQQLSTAKLPTAVRQELHNSMEEAKSGGRVLFFQQINVQVPLLWCVDTLYCKFGLIKGIDQ
jgi:hypothetical protein